MEQNSYTVVDVLNYLSRVEIQNLHITSHFVIRINERKGNICIDAKGIVNILLNGIPCGILKQSEEKFKLLYNLNDDIDIAVIISIKSSNPIKINLISCFSNDVKKRRR